MTKIKFLIYTFIYTAIGVLITFKAAPDIISSGKHIRVKPITYPYVEKIKFRYHKVGRQYLNTTIEGDFKTIHIQYYTPENKQEELLELLKKNKVIQNSSSFYTTIPVEFNKQDLSFIHKVSIIYTNKNEIQFLAFNNTTIKGSKSILRKYITLFLGYFLIAIGAIVLVLIPFGAYIQLKDYDKNGTELYVPNKLEGIKKFFYLFRKK